uniref:P0 protein n=1 Tax=Chrysanthemum virus D TaxID=3078488 RepID=A0AA96PTS3_9VIRU|nr:P0 protein [Chrysanthemum virus D]
MFFFNISTQGQFLIHSDDENYPLLDELEPLTFLSLVNTPLERYNPANILLTDDPALCYKIYNEYRFPFYYTVLHMLPLLLCRHVTATGFVISAPKSMLLPYIRWSIALGFFPKLDVYAGYFSITPTANGTESSYRTHLHRVVTDRVATNIVRRPEYVVQNGSAFYRNIAILTLSELSREDRLNSRILPVETGADLAYRLLSDCHMLVDICGEVYNAGVRSFVARHLEHLVAKGMPMDIWEFTIVGNCLPPEIYLQGSYLQKSLQE